MTQTDDFRFTWRKYRAGKRIKIAPTQIIAVDFLPPQGTEEIQGKRPTAYLCNNNKWYTKKDLLEYLSITASGFTERRRRYGSISDPRVMVVGKQSNKLANQITGQKKRDKRFAKELLLLRKKVSTRVNKEKKLDKIPGNGSWEITNL